MAACSHQHGGTVIRQSGFFRMTALAMPDWNSQGRKALILTERGKGKIYLARNNTSRHLSNLKPSFTNSQLNQLTGDIQQVFLHSSLLFYICWLLANSLQEYYAGPEPAEASAERRTSAFLHCTQEARSVTVNRTSQNSH
jgi:hypothetical protein